MRRLLLESLGKEVLFLRFTWSGRNSHHYRLQAGHELSSFMRKAITDYPNSQHAILAHSHGGNVALYSLADDWVRGHVTAVLCLATPFLSCRSRAMPKWILQLLGSTAVLLAMGATVVMNRWLMNLRFSEVLVWKDPVAQLFSVLLLRYVLPVFLFCVLIFSWFKRLDRRLQRLETSLSTEHARGISIVNIIPKGDEANNYLRNIRMIGETVYSVALRTLWAAMVISACSMIALTALGSLGLRQVVLRALFLVAVSLGVPAAIVGLSGLAILFMLLRGHRFGYGDSLFDNLVLDVSVSSLPAVEMGEADWEVIEIDEDDLVGGGLKHSRVYQSEEVVARLIEWMRKRLVL